MQATLKIASLSIFFKKFTKGLEKNILETYYSLTHPLLIEEFKYGNDTQKKFDFRSTC